MRIIAGIYRSRRLAAPPGLSTRPTSDRLRETLFNVLAPRMAGAAFLDLYAGSGAVGLEALSRGAAKVTFVERAPAALKILRRNLEQLGIEGGYEVRAEAVAGFLRSTVRRATEKILSLDKIPERHTSGPKGPTDSVRLTRGLKPPPPSISGFSAAYTANPKPIPHEVPKPGRYEVVFLDPPYDAIEEYTATLALLGGEHEMLAPGALIVAEHRRKQALAEQYGCLKRWRLLEQGDAALSFYEAALWKTQPVAATVLRELPHYGRIWYCQIIVFHRRQFVPHDETTSHLTNYKDVAIES
jgi:16S rRNA G966 N2-methylase RsmD